MKILLMLLFLHSFPTQLKIHSMYQPRILPRGQFYEVASFKQDGKKVCFVQYLAENYRQSFWGMKQVNLADECRDSFELSMKDSDSHNIKKQSEIFKVRKTSQGIEFVLNEHKRVKWHFNLWNYQKHISISLGKVKPVIRALKDQEICEDYNPISQCESLMKSRCSQCESGWTSVVGNGCLQKTKVCTSECGGKDEVACPQGIIGEDGAMNMVCPHQIEGAICQKGLTAICYENIVYCL